MCASHWAKKTRELLGRDLDPGRDPGLDRDRRPDRPDRLRRPLRLPPGFPELR
jgi:hypothetical protein